MTVVLSHVARDFLDFKQARTHSGELDPRTYADYRHACRMLLVCLGDARDVDSIRPLDFDRFRRVLADRYGPKTTGKHIRSVKTMFTWCYDTETIDRPVRYGGMFDPPSRAAVRKASKARRSMFEAHELRSLIEAATPPLRAFVLLGINAAYGQSDIAELPAVTAGVACRDGLLDFDRPKTGIARQCVLWPETVAAIEAVRRPAAQDGPAFLTIRGNPWVRESVVTEPRRHPDGSITEEIVKVSRSDALGFEFGKLCRRQGIATRGFYALRRTLRTVADGLPDRNAVLRVMGHELPGMDASYVVRVERDRLEVVSEHVRGWLWGSDAA